MRTWSKPQKIITQHNWCKVALDFNCHWLILSHVALTKFNSILFVIQFSNWTQLKIQQHVFNIVERGVREGGKNRLPIFSFVNEHNKKKNVVSILKERFLKISLESWCFHQLRLECVRQQQQKLRKNGFFLSKLHDFLPPMMPQWLKCNHSNQFWPDLAITRR